MLFETVVPLMFSVNVLMPNMQPATPPEELPVNAPLVMEMVSAIDTVVEIAPPPPAVLLLLNVTPFSTSGSLLMRIAPPLLPEVRLPLASVRLFSVIVGLPPLTLKLKMRLQEVYILKTVILKSVIVTGREPLQCRGYISHQTVMLCYGNL